MTRATSGAATNVAIGCRDRKLIYHLTALANLPSIVAHGLLTAAERARRRLGYVEIGDVSRRAALGLHELVPFHFLPKTPLAHEVAARGDAGPLVLLCVSRRRARRLAYGVIPHDPLAEPALRRASDGAGRNRRVSDWDVWGWDVWGWDEGVERVDWERIDAARHRRDDPHQRHALLAEAVSFERVPLRDLCRAYVATPQALAEARNVLRPAPSIRVIENEWMFPPAAAARRRHSPPVRTAGTEQPSDRR